MPPSTDRLSPHILRQDMKSCLMMEMLGNDDAVLRYLTKIHAQVRAQEQGEKISRLLEIRTSALLAIFGTGPIFVWMMR